MRTLWFFKTLKNNPNYLLCSDGVLYAVNGNKSVCQVVKKNTTSRQGYERYLIYEKGKRCKYRSVTGLLLEHFSLRRFIAPEMLEDCPF